MRLLFIFIDGVGLGKRDSSNPFYFSDTPNIIDILEGRQLTEQAIGFNGSQTALLGLDATLGVPGFPQSATGQASIFTGTNAALLLGKHLNGFPNKKLRRLIATKGIFKQLKEDRFQVNFANAYRPTFFELLQRGLPGCRYSCSTLITYYGDLTFYSIDDLREGRALYMDITNEILLTMGYDIPVISPEEGAHRLAEISSNFDFCLFEYFLSDLAGHLGDRSEASRIVNTLDRFIGSLVTDIDQDETVLVVTSDHGNLEDLSCRGHTKNLVPALITGNSEMRNMMFSSLNKLTDLLPVVQKVLSRKKLADQEGE